MASLSRYVGSDHSRTIKKIFSYVTIIVYSYLALCVLHSSWIVFRFFTIESADFIGRDIASDTRLFLLIVYLLAPFLIFTVIRAIYKHSSTKNEIRRLRDETKFVKKVIGSEGIKHLSAINDKIVINRGSSFDDDNPGHTVRQGRTDILNEFEWEE